MLSGIALSPKISDNVRWSNTQEHIYFNLLIQIHHKAKKKYKDAIEIVFRSNLKNISLHEIVFKLMESHLAFCYSIEQILQYNRVETKTPDYNTFCKIRTAK